MSEQDDPSLLNVRQAARALGIHANTLRRWESSGIIQAVRLPTGVRRFRQDDVSRLRSEMHETVQSYAAAERIDRVTPTSEPVSLLDPSGAETLRAVVEVFFQGTPLSGETVAGRFGMNGDGSLRLTVDPATFLLISSRK